METNQKYRVIDLMVLTTLVLILSTLLSCERNHLPVIHSLTCDPTSRAAGTLFTLEAGATDEDGDALTYHWEADGGEFRDSVNQEIVVWKSPITGVGQTFTLTVEVSDGKDMAKKDLQITLGEPEYGSISGQVKFTHYDLEVGHALIALDEWSVEADGAGRFQLSEIPAGTYTLTVTRQDFIPFTREVKVVGNQTVTVNPEITSVLYTTKLTGNVTDQDGTVIEGATVVVLNPDGSPSNLKSVTNANGFYRIWYIPHGERTLSISKAENDDNEYPTLTQDIMCQALEEQVLLTLRRIPKRGQFTDPRDGHTYNYKKIGKYAWMLENLAYLPEVMPSEDVDDFEPRYYVYDYQGRNLAAAKSHANYEVYGVLYNWPAARSACPPGWRLPDNTTAWLNLIITVGYPAGTKLKSTGGWENHGNGTNTFGFNALPAGRVSEDGLFDNLGTSTYFWAPSVVKTEGIYSLFFSSEGVHKQDASEKMGQSIRCIRRDE